MSSRRFFTPEQIDAMAFNLWCATTDRWGSLAERQAWEALPEAERRDWERQALAKNADYQALSPAARELANRGSMVEQLRRNDRELARLRRSDTGTPSRAEDT